MAKPMNQYEAAAMMLMHVMVSHVESPLYLDRRQHEALQDSGKVLAIDEPTDDDPRWTFSIVDRPKEA